MYFVIRRESFGQPHVRAVMPRFGFKQAAEKVGQLAIGQFLGQEAEPLAGAGLDQAGDEQPIDGPLRLLLADQVVELAAVAAGRQPAEANAAARQNIEHQMEMGQLLLDDLGHRPAYIDVVHIGKQQVHGRAGRLFLAVGVIDEQLVEMAGGL